MVAKIILHNFLLSFLILYIVGTFYYQTVYFITKQNRGVLIMKKKQVLNCCWTLNRKAANFYNSMQKPKNLYQKLKKKNNDNNNNNNNKESPVTPFHMYR